MTVLSYGREPVTIVEMEQTRCGLRFGVAPCAATGTPKCFQTYWTCADRENYNPSGSIKWRLSMPGQRQAVLYDRTGEHIDTNPIPCLRSVTTNPSRINLGAMRTGDSPFGTRGGVTVQISDIAWDDHVGDFYAAERTVSAPFWALWRARNRDPFRGLMFLRVYEGYTGQTLAEMQVRNYIVRDVTGPDASGNVTIRGDDPLQLADRKRAMFPRATDIRLVGELGETEAPRVFGNVSDLSAAFGNTGARRWLRIERELIGYTGWTVEGDGEFTLTGVTRADLGTQASTHADGDGCQRVGRYEELRMSAVLEDLLKAHTEIPDAYVNAGGAWDAERPWLLARTSATVADPTPVETLAGELCRDGGFVVWWDERTQTVPLLPLRPPQEAPVMLSGEDDILAGSAQIREAPDDRLTRVSIFYGQRDPTERQDDPANYRFRRIRVDAEVEGAAADGTIRERQMFSRWIRTDTNAFLVGAQQLSRYRITPEYLSLDVDAKDRALEVGSVVDVSSRVVLNSEGGHTVRRWQAISVQEVQHGHRVALELQAFALEGKRFALIMANDAPAYPAATEAQRDEGCWLADTATGKMPGGDEPYLLQ